MSQDTFERTLGFIERTEGAAWALGLPRYILLSGGEATEHPAIVPVLDRLERLGFLVVLITNGSWLADSSLRGAILRPRRRIMVQVTHDPRFYPTAPPLRVEDRRVGYVEAITELVPMGRIARKRAPWPLPTKKIPASFNVRSLTRSLGSFSAAVSFLRLRTIAAVKTGSFAQQCAPSVSFDGTVVAGENQGCYPLGTVDSTDEALTHAVLTMGSCNRCTLEANLPPAHKAAIGVPS